MSRTYTVTSNDDGELDTVTALQAVVADLSVELQQARRTIVALKTEIACLEIELQSEKEQNDRLFEQTTEPALW